MRSRKAGYITEEDRHESRKLSYLVICAQMGAQYDNRKEFKNCVFWR